MKNIKYKMYKDGKFLVFAGLIFIGAVTGITLDNTHYASADSTDVQADGSNGQDILANKKSVILDSQKSTDTQQTDSQKSTDTQQTDSQKSTDTQQTDSQKSTDTQQTDSQKSTDTQQADSQKSTDTQQTNSQKSTDTQQSLSNRIGDVVSTYVGREQFNHISRDIHFRAATGENGADSVDIPDNLLPSDVNSFVDYYRYPVYDSNNQLVGYSSDGQQNDISLDDTNQGWRVRGQATQLPDVDVPDLSAKGFDVNTNKVTSNYNVQQGFTDSLDGNVDKIRNNYYTADGSSQIVSNPTNNLNSYEHVTITYHYVRTKEYNTSNFYRQIDYVNKNENDGVQAGSHIADSRFDAINYRQIKVFQKGKFLGYSTTNNSLNVDLPADDANQGWRLYANPNNEEQYLWNWNNGVSPESIPDVQSPVISGYGSPSISTVISNYQIGAPTAEGTGFTNKNGDPNVWISGQTGFPNTFEYVKVVYPSANNKVVSQTKTITRVINYLDRSAYDLNGQKVVDNAKVAQTVTQTVTFKRDAVYSADGDLLGYTSGKYGDKTPDISIQGGDRAWQLDDTGIWTQVDSPDLSSKGYSSPDRSSINQYSVKSTDADVIENVFYSKQSTTVGPNDPKVPGTPINPDNPNGPKWPAGTDEDSLSRSITRTIKYIDSDTGKEVSKDVTETVNYYRTAVVDKVTGALLGYSTDGTDTVTLTPDQADKAWLTDNNKWAEVTSPDLTDKGYSTPDRAKIDEIIVPFNGQDTQEVVKYNHKVDTVTPENPGIPGQPINPDNPNGPKWPNGTDKDSLSKAINQTINYVDGNGKIVHDPSHDQVTFSRTATVDEVTGQVTYTDWNNASETFSPKVSPVIPGYVLRDDSQKTISGITVNPSSSDNSETVIYDKVGSLVPVDTTGNPIDNGSHNTSYPNDPNDAGKVTNPIIPNIPGKTPVDKNGNPLTPGNNYPIDGSKPTEDTKLTYVDSNQKAKVSYVDSTTGKTLEIVDLSGQPQSTSNYRTTDTIKKYTDQGYKLVNDNYPASGVKFNSDDKEQDFTVTLEHKVDTVTPENPGIPGQPINPDNPNGPKWPNGTDKDSLSKAINQTINYVDGNGKIVHDPSHDQVTFSRTATVDEVTGQVTYTDWNNASETFSPKVSPVIPGYVLRDDSQKTISGITVNPSSSDNSETVIYDKVGSLVPVDTTGNPIDNGSHNTSYPNDPNDAGKVTNPIIPNIPGKTPVDKNGNPLTPGNNYPIDGSKPTEDTKLTYVDSNQKAKVSYVDSTTGKTLEIVDLSGQPQSTSNYRTTDTIKKYTDQGYKLVNDNYPASGVKFNSDDKEQDFTVTLEHKVDTVTPENPGIPGQPINPDNPNGPKWPNGTDKDSLSKAINQTINYVDGNGKIVHDPSHDQVTFSRTATVDEVTGQVTYTDWNNASETFSPKVSPVIPGYVLRDDSQKTISGITVNPSSSDNSETVIYDKVGSLVPVDTNEPKIPNSTDKSSPVEPETGIRSQKYDVNTGLLAKIIILISGLLFLTRKKKND